MLDETASQATIILSHGAGRDRRAWMRHCKFLISNGYTCLLYDSRNHGISDRYGAAGTSLGVLEWHDVAAVTRWAKESSPVGTKIVLMGTR